MKNRKLTNLVVKFQKFKKITLFKGLDFYSV